MKKSNKKIPKSHLPKYSPGGTTSQFSDEVQYDSMYTSGMGDRYATNNSGNNMYNDRRASKIKSQEQAQQTGQYVAAASAGVDGGINMMNTYKNPDATIAEGWNAGADTGANIVGSFGPWGQVLGMGIKATTKGGDALRTGFFEKANADGSLKNPRLAEAAAFTNTVANPLTWGSMINKGIYTPRQYRDTVEQENKDRIASQGQMFPMGGMNMQPNAEVELEENTLNPDGSTTQYDGASHEQGGIPTNLDPGTLIFSDKLKMGGKTFAKLNKPNMTSKEDKILSDNKASAMSKLTANLMKQAKNKSSVELFEAQEALKQSKLDNYTKRLGGIMKYPDGGPVDTLGTKVDAPPANYNFLKNVGNKQVYVDPGFIRKAPGSTSKSDPNNWNKFLIGQLQNGVSPDELAGKGYGTKEGLNPLMKYYKPRYAYIEPLGKPSTTPTNTQMPYDQRIDRKEVSQNMSTDVNYYDYPDANAGYSKATRVAFDRNSGREIDPMKSYDNTGTYKPFFNLETGRDLYKNTIKSSIPGTNPNNANLNNPADLRTEARQSSSFKYGGIQQFKKGGVKGNTYTPRVQDANDSEDIVVPGTRPASKDFTDVLAPDQYNTFGKPLDNWEAARLNKSAWDADYMNNPSAPNPNVTNPDSKNFDWKGLATQSAYFAANNAGNIYDLARANKTETRKYNRATENLVTPNFRDADQKYLYMKNALKGASLGASGYLANLQQSHVNHVLNKAQIQQAADNTNAGIKNQVSQYNTGIANEEILANAKIRANARNIKQSAIASIGSNSANQMNDVRNTEMDKKKMDGLIKMYPSLSKDPKMLEYFMSFNA